MKLKLKRAWAAVAAVAVAGTLAPFVAAPAAHAAGTLSGAASASPSSGSSGTSFTLSLPSGAACPGDSPNDGYRWQTYMVPSSVDPATLTFGSSGPLPTGVGANFRQPLYTTTGSPVVNRQTPAADTPGGPGPIINIPATDYAVFAPGDIPAGVYNIGIACTLGSPSATQMKNFWNVQKTFTTNAAGGPAQVDWSVGAVPAAPVLQSPLGAGDGTLTATFTHAASTPASSLFTATATPVGGGTPVTGTSATVSPITISGLTNGTAYDVTVRATNSVGDSAESNTVQGTPTEAARPPVQNLTATPGAPGSGTIDLAWQAPASGPAPTGYAISVSPNEGTVNHTGTSTTASVTGLTAGTPYTFTVTPTHPAPSVGTPTSTGPVSVSPSTVLVQDVTVTRPAGAIVLTQVCGKHGDIGAETDDTVGFPKSTLPAIPAAAGTKPADESDASYGQYPYPTNADGTPNPTYPTHCGINMGTATFVRTGPGAGQFFAASGVLNQVTVVDTRDTDTGWTATGTMSSFTATGGKSFSGSQLGWTPEKDSDTEPFTDADGVTYDQVAAPGGRVNPNTQGGLGNGETLGSAAGRTGTTPSFTGGLGIASFDARLKLLIPVTAKSGAYVGTLTITVTGG